MPNPSSIISSSQQSSFSNISSSFASAEIGMLMPILQGLMNGSGWVYLGDEISQRDQQEALQEAQLQQVALDYKADPSPKNRQQLVSNLKSLLNVAKSEYADIRRKQRQAEQEARHYSDSLVSWSDWLIASLKDFFGSTPDQQAEKYAQIAEIRHKKMTQLKAALNYLGEPIIDEKVKPSRKSSSKNSEVIIFPPAINLNDPLNGQNGFKIVGESGTSYSGSSVSEIGDINGDGIADLLIGAPNYGSSSSLSYNGYGRSYVIFGESTIGNSGIVELNNLNGVNGFKINGESNSSYGSYAMGSGYSVSSAGDINGDHIADLIIGAPGYNFTQNNSQGRSYVLFGGINVGSSGILELDNLNGSNGFKINGEFSTLSSYSVSNAGDINNDGITDLLIGAPGSSYPVYTLGYCYVIFGQTTIGSLGIIELANLNGTNGFKIYPESNLTNSYSVSEAGDINDDGIADLLIGAPSFNNHYGRSYVVFGNANIGSSGIIKLADLNGTNGFKIDGESDDNGDSGSSVYGAEDVNGDNIDDLLIGAPEYNEHGRCYVVFGGPTVGTSGLLSLSALNGTNGFKIYAEYTSNSLYADTGASVNMAQDINGDGIADLLIGAPCYGYMSNGCVGRSYAVFGGATIGSSGIIELAHLNGANGFKIKGESPYGALGASVSAAEDINGDGIADLLIGAPYYDGHIGRSYIIFSNGTFPFPSKNSPLALILGTTLGAISFLALSSYLLYRYKQKQVTSIVLNAVNNDPSVHLLSEEILNLEIPEENNSELSSSLISLKTESIPSSNSNSESRPLSLSKKSDKDEKEEKKATVSSGPLELKLSLDIPFKELHFTKRDKLGSGAYSIVYQGIYNLNQVAIKQLHARHLSTEAIAELKQEATIMGAMRSDYIVSVRGICLEEPHYCLVMELMPKGSLYHLLKNNAELPLSVRLRIGLDVISGLYQLHKEAILHRDLKSLNVLLNDQLRAKISDFGLSKVKSEVASQSTVRSKGTLIWMSPELCDEKPASTASDIYAYGMVLWELMVKPYQIPFHGLSPSGILAAKLNRKEAQEKIPTNCPADVSGLIKSCWRASNQRPSAEALLKSLQPIFAAAEQKAKPASILPVAMSEEPLARSLVPSYGSNLQSS